MVPGDFHVRDATPDDAAAIAGIYAYHVIHGTASYDTGPPPTESFKANIEWVRASGWPFLVMEHSGDVIGFAYATQIRDRAGYRWTAENSIYVRADAQGQGVGRALLEALLDRAEACGFRQIVAVIGGAAEASVRLHAACGFREVGRLHAAGWKHGRWLDNVYMQKSLGAGSTSAPDAE